MRGKVKMRRLIVSLLLVLITGITSVCFAHKSEYINPNIKSIHPKTIMVELSLPKDMSFIDKQNVLAEFDKIIQKTNNNENVLGCKYYTRDGFYTRFTTLMEASVNMMSEEQKKLAFEKYLNENVDVIIKESVNEYRVAKEYRPPQTYSYPVTNNSYVYGPNGQFSIIQSQSQHVYTEPGHYKDMGYCTIQFDAYNYGLSPKDPVWARLDMKSEGAKHLKDMFSNMTISFINDLSIKTGAMKKVNLF